MIDATGLFGSISAREDAQHARLNPLLPRKSFFCSSEIAWSKP